MSWCPDGTYIADKFQDKVIISASDVPELDKIRQQIHG